MCSRTNTVHSNGKLQNICMKHVLYGIQILRQNEITGRYKSKIEPAKNLFYETLIENEAAYSPFLFSVLYLKL